MFSQFSDQLQRIIIGSIGALLFGFAFLAAAVGPAQAGLSAHVVVARTLAHG